LADEFEASGDLALSLVVVVYGNRKDFSLQSRQNLFAHQLIYIYCTLRRVEALPNRPSNQLFGLFSNSAILTFFDAC